jgi:hypothetical protein
VVFPHLSPSYPDTSHSKGVSKESICRVETQHKAKQEEEASCLLGYTEDKGTFTTLGLKLVYGDGLIIVASYDDTKEHK